jgi:hypothetical protein
VKARRDAGIDAVRAIAIAGVVIGHWLVTALVIGDDGALHARSPLAELTGAQPVSWLLQTLGLFFLAGGYAAAASAARRRPTAEPAAMPVGSAAVAGPAARPRSVTGVVALLRAAAGAAARLWALVGMTRPRSVAGVESRSVAGVAVGPRSTVGGVVLLRAVASGTRGQAVGGLAGGSAATPGAADESPAARSVTARPWPAGGAETPVRPQRRRIRVPRRLRILLVPVGSLLGLLALALTAGAFAGVPEETLRTVGKLVVSPLWFLLPFLVLTALITPIARLVRRFGPLPLAAGAAAVVLAADLGHGFLPTTLVAAWTVPFVLGVALAQGRLSRPSTGWLLLAGGAAAAAALVFVAGYPTSAVGVPGAGRSNLDPPSLAAIALAVAQTGAVLLLLPWLRRLGTRRPVRALNDAALPVYLWHQATMISVTVATAWFVGRRPGLLAEPDDYGWAAARLAWLPLFAAALALVVRIARQSPARSERPDRTVRSQPSGQCHATLGQGIESPMVRVPGRRMEVIAVRDSDPPSRSRAAVRSR